MENIINKTDAIEKSGIALQKAEDNKKEITYIYKKLKEINTQIENISSGGSQVDLTQISTTLASLQTSVASLSSTSTQNTSDITNLQSAISTAQTNLTNLTTRVSANETNISSLQTQVSANTTAIATLQQNQGGGGGNSNTNNSTEILENKYCYVNKISAIVGNRNSSHNNKAFDDLKIFTKEKNSCYFTIKLIFGKTFVNEISGKFKAYLNDEEIFCELNNKIMREQTDYEFLLQFKGVLKQGENILYIKPYYSITGFPLKLKYLSITIQSQKEILLTQHEDFNLITNGTSYLLKNGMLIKYVHNLQDENALLTYDYLSNHNTNTLLTTYNPTDIQYAYMPILNTQTNQIEKGDYVYCNQVANTVWIYFSSTNYKSFALCDELNIPFGFGEYCNPETNDYGVCAIYQGTYNNQPNLICGYRSETAFAYGFPQGTLPENFGKIYYYDVVKTLSNIPMNNLTVIAYNTDGNAFFIKTDFNRNKPYVNSNNIIEILNNVKKSHTYFYDNKYYCFYYKDNCIKRKIFTYSNNQITTISDEEFSDCDELLVVNNDYIMEIRNNLPYFVEKCFYE